MFFPTVQTFSVIKFYRNEFNKLVAKRQQTERWTAFIKIYQYELDLYQQSNKKKVKAFASNVYSIEKSDRQPMILINT